MIPHPSACMLACLVASLSAPVALAGAQSAIDEAPGQPGEWGFRPDQDSASPVNPPAFVWRPQSGAASYELQCSRDESFADVAYQAAGIAYNCHCPPKTLQAGTWYWRFRFADKAGRASAWSKARRFTIAADAVAFSMPPREELLGRIPKQHPRLFIRPEQLPRLRELARGELSKSRDALIAQCDKLLASPPPTAEPPKYPPEVSNRSEEWRELWWGNRVYTIKVLNSAATLAFTRLLTGNDAYGRLAKRLLLDAAKWDPKGATGYRYNDEAGMPYNYYFSRTYSFVNDLLSEAERAECRRVMAVRGEEMYSHLCPRHIWRPYGSHQNRAWHFLGEVGVAFLGELPEAAEWVWFAMNVFYNVYPVWSDSDGGWHEGVSYWSSYIHRFTWWADIMRAAMGVDAYRKPYFASVGYYPMYLQPPGTVGGGFGDLCATRKSADNRQLMTVLAAQASNGYWQWYVQSVGGPAGEGGYVEFVRGNLPKVAPKPPGDLPSSRCFRGTGLAMLNARLDSAADNVEIIFKSSPFGTQSHGYESSNSFLLYAFGERLLIRTGRRDIYGSAHHSGWMWTTRSTNCITVDGAGQGKHTAAAQGRIVAFHASPAIDYVAGEAGAAYGGALRQFTRHVVFVKPDLVVIYDVLRAAKPSTFQWLLHAPTEMKLAGQGDVRVVNGKAAARVAFLHPAGLGLSQSNLFDPPPRERIKLVEYHLTAATKTPAEAVQFVTAIRPHRSDAAAPQPAALAEVTNGYALQADLPAGRAVVLLRAAEKGAVQHAGLQTDAEIAAIVLDANGKVTDRLEVSGETVRHSRGNP